MTDSSREYIAARVAIDDGGCWIWQLALSDRGYGRTDRDGQVKAHRLAYQTFVGPIPDSLTLDHLCRNRACCNPAHLELVTNAGNLARSARVVASACANGHQRIPENVKFTRQGRRCRECLRQWEHARRARRHAMAVAA